MTTPKKARYQLRNRIVMGPASTQAGNNQSAPGGPGSNPGTPSRLQPLILDGSFSDDAITDEEIPEQLQEEQIEALTEEIKKLQVWYFIIIIKTRGHSESADLRQGSKSYVIAICPPPPPAPSTPLPQ